MGSGTQIDWEATGAMLGGLAAVATFLVAMVALLVAVRQLKEVNRLNAEDSYLSFHRISFENPRYAEPNLSALKTDDAAMVQYHWFVISMMMCIERILNCLPGDMTWRLAVTDDLDSHREYVTSDEFGEYVPNFSPVMQNFLKEYRDKYQDVPGGVSAPRKRIAGARTSRIPVVTNTPRKARSGVGRRKEA